MKLICQINIFKQLECLSIQCFFDSFTHCVSLPLLNFVEVNSPDKLLDIFPKLFQDLKNEKIDTLPDYLVVHNHVPIEPLTSETGHLHLMAMCDGA